jgi:hypothetical protein
MSAYSTAISFRLPVSDDLVAAAIESPPDEDPTTAGRRGARGTVVHCAQLTPLTRCFTPTTPASGEVYCKFRLYNCGSGETTPLKWEAKSFAIIGPWITSILGFHPLALRLEAAEKSC